MASRIYSSEVIELQDGTEVTLRPLPIGRLRKFMKAWEAFKEVEDEDGVFDIYVQCCGISLSNEFGAKFEETLDLDGGLSNEYKVYLEDVLDIETIFKILEVCGGINLNDPKLTQAAQEAAKEAGTN